MTLPIAAARATRSLLRYVRPDFSRQSIDIEHLEIDSFHSIRCVICGQAGMHRSDNLDSDCRCWSALASLCTAVAGWRCCRLKCWKWGALSISPGSVRIKVWVG